MITKTQINAYKNENATVRSWRIPHYCDQMRADLYLTQKIERISRTNAQRIIRKGDFRLSDRPAKPAQRVGSGDLAELWQIAPMEKSVSTGISVNILYEDQNIIVLDKPAGIVVHPSAKDLNFTLTAWLKENFPGAKARPCHRLDRETSGVIVCARSRQVDSTIKNLFRDGKVKKTYLAIVLGHLQSELTIDWPLALQGNRGLVRIRMIKDPNGRPSITNVNPLSYSPEKNVTLVTCQPKTGRQHQIRAHLAEEGFPILGDKLYAMGEKFFDEYTKSDAPKEQFDLPHKRQALHAYAVEFEYEGKVHRFLSPLPKDLKCLINHPQAQAYAETVTPTLGQRS